MNFVSQLLAAKGSDVWSVRPDVKVLDALRLMADKNVGALLVRDDSAVIGLFSERDYARRVVLVGKSSKDTPVRDIMSTKIVYVRPDQTVEECMGLMTQKRIRHLPVMEDDELVGIVSIGDVVKAVIAEQEFLIHQLENYISGSMGGL